MCEFHSPALPRFRQAAVGFALLGATLLLLFACAPPTERIEIPPRVELKTWPLIGVVDFTSNSDPRLAREATEKVVQDLEAAQPGARLLELGSGARVLRELQRTTFDPDTIKTMGARYGVAAVLTGHLELSGMIPDIHMSPADNTFSAAAKINSQLSAKLRETPTGATVWSDTAHGQWSLGKLRYGGGSVTDLHYSDPGDLFREILGHLAWRVTEDFRPTVERRRVAP